jgi:hypothetical protein
MNLWLSENFYDNKKIKRLILELGAEAIPCLHRLWFYAAKYAVDNLLNEDRVGVLKDFDEIDIELTAEWKGKQGKFVELLKKLKLLDMKRNEYYVHDFADNNPQIVVLIKQKINGSKYARKRWENKQKGEPIGDPNGNPMQKEKKRKENKEKETTKEVVLPDWLDKKAWLEYVQHRRDIKKKLTPLAIKKSLSILEKNKSSQSAIIDKTICNGWTGLFELKKQPKQEAPLYTEL